MAISKSIFKDLEINTDGMTKDPVEFSRGVYQAADKLLAILSRTSSQGVARQEVKTVASKDHDARKVAIDAFEEDYVRIVNFAETVELNVLFHVISQMKELVRDLELTLDHRASSDMIRNSPSNTDKGLAHEQYKDLRDAFENYRSFINLVVDDEIILVPLKPKTGNYGGTNTRSYPAYRVGNDVYKNYRAVARILGIDPDSVHSHMDLQEAMAGIDLATFNVEVIEVQL